MVRPARKTSQHTYRDAGVDIDANDRLKEIICQHARTTFTPGVISDIGFFGSLFELKGYKQPILVSSADGVGTKIKIACALGKHEGIGMDIVNHCVNDILTCGASPLFFLDYIAMSKMDAAVVASIVKGMAEACKNVDCALIGGETAEMPGTYPKGEYDLVGFIVGGIEKPDIKNGSSIKAGDMLIGLPSSGLHTNGYSLVRRVFNTDADPSRLKRRYPQLGRTLGDALLEPPQMLLPSNKASAPQDQRPGPYNRRRFHREPAAHAAQASSGNRRQKLMGGTTSIFTHPADRQHRRRGDVPRLQHGHRHDPNMRPR